MSRQWLRHAAGSLLLPAQRLWSRTAGSSDGGFRILTFHHVRPSDSPRLERLIDYLLENHGILTPAEAQQCACGKESHDGRVPYLLTFDDGFRSNFDVARSILAPRSIKALFFVCPALIESPPERQRELTAQYVFDGAINARSLDPALVLMNWNEIRSLFEAGHAIGSHAASHRRLSTLQQGELIEEITGSAALLREKLRSPVTWFAYPFGTVESMSSEAYEVVQRTYLLCCSAVRGINRPGSPLALFRENIDLDTPFRYQQFVSEGGLDFYYRSRRRILKNMLPAARAMMREGMAGG